MEQKVLAASLFIFITFHLVPSTAWSQEYTEPEQVETPEMESLRHQRGKLLQQIEELHERSGSEKALLLETEGKLDEVSIKSNQIKLDNPNNYWKRNDYRRLDDQEKRLWKKIDEIRGNIAKYEKESMRLSDEYREIGKQMAELGNPPSEEEKKKASTPPQDQPSSEGGGVTGRILAIGSESE